MVNDLQLVKNKDFLMKGTAISIVNSLGNSEGDGVTGSGISGLEDQVREVEDKPGVIVSAAT